ncbi:MAG: HAMP domain-containing protein [Betaproteobacteria bacterium]|nr:HAMP domain-containing protein [Betaproteobacteria bacterium]
MTVPSRLTRWFGLHAQVALVALTLLVIPWVGYTYVRSMEKMLRQNQEQQLIAAARGIAAALQDRPRLLELRGPAQKITEIKPDDTPPPEALAAQDNAAPPPAEGDASNLDAALAPPKPLPPPELAAPPAATTTASEEVRIILAGLARAGLRIWVIDTQLQLVATAGNLHTKHKYQDDPASFGPIEKAVGYVLQPVFTRLFPPPPIPDEEFIPNDVVFGGKELERALDGSPSLRRRPAPQRGVILSAAHPIWVTDKVVGAVVVEENTNVIISLGNRAFQQLVAVTLIAFAAAALVLLLFASRLSWRLRRLRDEAENAIDSQGRMRGLLTAEHANDEIGDLSRAFSTMLERLAQYNAHLEKLAQRLSHELRTPIAVVRSSLDNVKLQSLPSDAGVYIERAEGGLNRLETILTRMAEATRLEQAVRNEEREPFDAWAVLAGCVSGYAAAHPKAKFELAMTAEPVTLTGAPDLFAQMLDKLAANAADFATPGTPINVSLQRIDGNIVLQFSNSGPPLPPEIAGRFFDSMISVRKAASDNDNPHLGLGLYIVRLIAEFHGGKVSARNWDNSAGVVVEVRIAPSS